MDLLDPSSDIVSRTVVISAQLSILPVPLFAEKKRALDACVETSITNFAAITHKGDWRDEPSERQHNFVFLLVRRASCWLKHRANFAPSRISSKSAQHTNLLSKRRMRGCEKWHERSFLFASLVVCRVKASEKKICKLSMELSCCWLSNCCFPLNWLESWKIHDEKLAAECEKFSQIIFVIALELGIDFWSAICGNKRKLSGARESLHFVWIFSIDWNALECVEWMFSLETLPTWYLMGKDSPTIWKLFSYGFSSQSIRSSPQQGSPDFDFVEFTFTRVSPCAIITNRAASVSQIYHNSRLSITCDALDYLYCIMNTTHELLPLCTSANIIRVDIKRGGSAFPSKNFAANSLRCEEELSISRDACERS